MTVIYWSSSKNKESYIEKKKKKKINYKNLHTVKQANSNINKKSVHERGHTQMYACHIRTHTYM